MIVRIKSLEPVSHFHLSVLFDDGKRVLYDVGREIQAIPSYRILEEVPGLFEQVQLDQSRTCVFWNEDVDLPSDGIYEYGVEC